MPNHRLSKSRVMAYRQCPKRLHLQTFRPELASYSDAASANLVTGENVGRIARDLVPGGRLIGHQEDLPQALAETAEALKQDPARPLFEATVQHGGVLVRADILLPEAGGYRLREVKSSASVKPYHPADVAIQAWALQGAGVALTAMELAHVDSSWVYPGGGDYRGLLVAEDVGDAVRPLLDQVPRWVQEIQALLDGPEPAIGIGAHCFDPYECPFYAHCSAGVEQPQYPVWILPHVDGKGLAAQFAEEGFADLREVPPERLGKEKFLRIWRASVSGKPEFLAGAEKDLRALPHPHHFLDFEGIQFAVPIWAGTRPYQQIPFQWSCHTVLADGSTMHREFLDTSGDCPMRAFAESLLECVGESGTVFIYNQAYEAARVRELARNCPDLAPRLTALLTRFCDLLPLTRAHYYHPEMKGSWSLKAVLPTVAPELDYGGLEGVHAGDEAQLAYLELINPATAPERKAELERALREYCARDTQALIRVASFLAGGGQTPQSPAGVAPGRP